MPRNWPRFFKKISQDPGLTTLTDIRIIWYPEPYLKTRKFMNLYILHIQFLTVLLEMLDISTLLENLDLYPVMTVLIPWKILKIYFIIQLLEEISVIVK